MGEQVMKDQNDINSTIKMFSVHNTEIVACAMKCELFGIAAICSSCGKALQDRYEKKTVYVYAVVALLIWLVWK